MRVLLLINMFFVLMYAESYHYYEFGKKVELKELKDQRSAENDNSNIRYYLKNNSQKVGITNDILVKCHDSSKCIDILNQYKLDNISKLTKDIFVVSLQNTDNIFEVCEKLYQDKEIKFAVPNTVKERQKR